MQKIIIIMGLVVFLLGSCKKTIDETWDITLPETKKPTNLSQWAVVMYEYPKLRDTPFINAQVINYIPAGTIVRIIKRDAELKMFENEAGYWCYIDYDGERGWIFSIFLEIYNSFRDAEKRGEEILMKLKP